MAGDREKALKAGCDEYDSKPVDLPRLPAKIEALVGGASRSGDGEASWCLEDARPSPPIGPATRTSASDLIKSWGMHFSRMENTSMRWSRVRFTLQWMMIAVAVVAVILAQGVSVHRRKERLRQLANYHRTQRWICFDIAFKNGPNCLMGYESFRPERQK